MMQCRFSCLARPLLRFLRDEDGATAVEYALMLALIFVVAVSAIQSFGKTTRNTFQYSVDKITTKGS
jgi:pilus assembly protein Flp/PilA